jgi:hypothetical protein
VRLAGAFDLSFGGLIARAEGDGEPPRSWAASASTADGGGATLDAVMNQSFRLWLFGHSTDRLT